MWYLPVSTIDFDFGEAGDEGVRDAVARVVVARDAHQPLTGERRRRRLRERVDVLRQLVAVVLAAELDRLLRRLRERHAAARAATRARWRRCSARVCRRGSSRQSPAASSSRRSPAACAARVIAWVVWLPPDTQLHGRFLPVLPQVTSHFSHGMPDHLGRRRDGTSLIDSVPRLPMPDWMYIRPSGLMTNRPSKPVDPATKRAHRHADAADLRALPLAAAAPCARPS